MRQQADRLGGVFAYNTDLFAAPTIAGMRKNFVTLLHGIVADPDARLETLHAILTQAERQAHMEQQHASSASQRLKLGRARRQAMRLSPGQLVSMAPLRPETNLPWLVQPALAGVDLRDWARGHLPDLERALLEHGALLFRGFKIASAEAFAQFAQVVTPHLLDYIEGASPRLRVSDKIYTSTEYPAAYAIAMHNELSYSHAWPGKLFFGCLTAPSQGGETPLADSRTVLALLAPEIVARFRQKGVMYVRNFHGGRGSGQSWQTAFATTDTAAVEAYCRAGDVAWHWKADGGLRLSQVRPACATHPQMGDMVWFNQAHQWHLSNLEPEVARALGATVPEDELPMQAYYGDGSALEAAVLAEIRAAYQQATVTFPWQAGDILLLDNMLIAHGRRPFVGPRTVLVAMGAPISLNNVSQTS
jgi:alpha-ketoglutarate-dependent taurine dioxygenase